MIEQLFSGSSFKLDPTLTILKPGTCFSFDKKERLVVTDKQKLGIVGNHIDINYYALQDCNRNNYRLIEDKTAGVLFIYKELMVHDLDGEPPFVKEPKLNLEIDGKTVEFEDYSGLIQVRLDNMKNLVHIYTRNLDETEQEYLWCEVWNNKKVQYFVGVDIHKSQIIV